MGDRLRWALILVLPILGGVFLLVRALWLAYVRTLNESELHLRVFDQATTVAVSLWAVILGLTIGATWWGAGRLAARDWGGSAK
jgi:ABC-type transporter Mla maintaining outer membrane lipid asymmetry permease subunit MlaE